ncbi:hypothetical protein GQ600_26478 [Phytophthora cactorum]|nr:hypothetical protein GQ600_26478 [Phytophthora cactorum]
MRAEMSKCDIEVMRGRGEVQLLLERMLARQTMKRKASPKMRLTSSCRLRNHEVHLIRSRSLGYGMVLSWLLCVLDETEVVTVSSGCLQYGFSDFCKHHES